MKKVILSMSLLFMFAFSGYTQSGRRSDPIKLETDELKGYSVALLFSKANNYANEQFSKLEKEKKPYTQSLHRRVLSEQKQLAAKYGNHAKTRENLIGDDYYYLGRLHWMGTNPTDAAVAFEKFIETKSGTPQKLQTARSVLVVISAAKKEFEKAESFLKTYYENEPTKLTEIAKMEKEMALAYITAKTFDPAAPHADKVFEVSQTLLETDQSRARALNRLMDAGVTSFEVQRELGNRQKAESALVTLRDKSITVQSHGVYFKAMDALIKFYIYSGRRVEAAALYKDTIKRIPKDFQSKSQAKTVLRKLRKKEKHYEILGQPAPKLIAIENWLPARPKPLSGFKGKVVLLDFWATWCGPCIEAFPSLIDWHETYKDEGLEIIGVTRFYGQGNGRINKPKELGDLVRFKKTYTLPYTLAVAYGQANQYTYGATAIPTAVLIDRRGIVRYVESGAGKSRKKELLLFIKKLLAEE